jgi:hypothetical protein
VVHECLYIFNILLVSLRHIHPPFPRVQFKPLQQEGPFRLHLSWACVQTMLRQNGNKIIQSIFLTLSEFFTFTLTLTCTPAFYLAGLPCFKIVSISITSSVSKLLAFTRILVKIVTWECSFTGSGFGWQFADT